MGLRRTTPSESDDNFAQILLVLLPDSMSHHSGLMAFSPHYSQVEKSMQQNQISQTSARIHPEFLLP
jgi:hypothetical protein